MLKFKIYDLIFNGEYPEISSLSNCLPKKTHYFQHGEKHYGFNWQIRDGRFFLIYADYDGLHYKDTVYNKNTEKEISNPRKAHELELKMQFFVCYDKETDTLYISNAERKGVLTKYLKEFYPKDDIRIRERFASIEEFTRRIKILKSIRFVQSRTLHNQDLQSIFSRRYDILGVEIPDKITVKIEYNNLVTRLLNSKKFNELQQLKDTGVYDSISIVGEDADGIETAFDFETLISSIKVNAEQNENYRYDTEEVFNLLISELKTKNV
jgi:hypothetical protein